MEKKLIIIGNGFDRAHDLRTGYNQFTEANKESEHLILFQKLAEQNIEYKSSGYQDNKYKDAKWNDFEKIMEKVICNKYIAFARDEELDINEKIQEINDLFEQIEKLLMDYLKQEVSISNIVKRTNIEDCITKDAYVISFNYTDTPRIYTDNIYYIHGSISQDQRIILGFAWNNLPCLCNGDFIWFDKNVKREELNFYRYLKNAGCKNIDEECRKFKAHAMSLCGNRGEYDLEYNDAGSYNVDSLSMHLKEYAISNNFNLAPIINDFSETEEIVIMGHGLESDQDCLEAIFSKTTNLKRITLFTYEGECQEDLRRKIEYLEKKTKLKVDNIRFY